jgi:serine protease Do
MAKKRKQTKQNQKILTSIIITIIIILIGYYLYYTYSNIEITPQNYETQRTLSTGNEQNVEKAEEKSRTIADTLEKTMESVVGISKLKDNGNSIFSSNTESTLGLGTGVIISENGYILSNEHVTGEKYSTCYITLENSKKYEGTVVWSDTDLDLSITKIEATNLKYISLGDSDKIRIGETVYAIGNPIGFEFRRTVTSGIISSKNRTIKLEEKDKVSYMSDLIQTDATINPGNSGGPLININGEVLGINSVKITSAEGIGFSIPINIIKPIIEKLTSTGECITPSLGVFAYDKNIVPYINQELDQNIKLDKGIYIADVTKNSPAEKVGVKRGDILLEIDGIELEKMSELRTYIYGKNVGEKVNIKLVRSNKEYQISVTLAKK